MRTDRRCEKLGFGDPWIVSVRVFVGMLFLCAFGLGSVPAGAQVSIDDRTEVRSIKLSGAHSLSETRLRGLIQTPTRGSAYRLRSMLGKLPFVPSPSHKPFDPRVLAEDVVRLRRLYFTSGFPQAKLRYEVGRDDEENLLDITFVVEEGISVRVVDVRVASVDSAVALPVPAEERESWGEAEQHARGLSGGRLDIEAALKERDRLQLWWRDRGFPGAKVEGFLDRDSLRHESSVRYVVAPGPRFRIGSVEVQGNKSISDNVVERELSFRRGDYYSESAIAGGRRDLQQLQIVRAARFEIGSHTEPESLEIAESTLPVLVTVTEAKPRLVSGQVGYVTDAGLSSEVRWNHRNFTGGARVLTVSGLAQTGWLAISGDPDIRYRGTVSLQQPHVIHRRISGLISPFVEYRDDTQDRSLQVGSNFTLVYRRSALFSGSVDYRLASRKIYEYRIEELASGNVDLLTFLTQVAEGQLDSLGTTLGSSIITLSGTAGSLDDIANPHQGGLVRPTMQVTVPNAWCSSTYWRADVTALAFAPVSRRTTLAGRIALGRLFPFGKSVPAPDEPPEAAVLRLSDANFTAGGSSDVRGWGYRMLGPKFPDIRFQEEGDSLTAYASGYVPLGGFSRVSFSLELRLPMPALGPKFGSTIFLDGARVWTQDDRFTSGEDTYDQRKYFYATGLGLDLLTPVGAIRVGVGYKLNPSILDLVDSQDVLQASINETPTDQLEKHNLRRWQFYLVIGSNF